MGLNIKGINAKDLFYGRLAGISEPEQKRKIIGASFIDVFDEAAKEIQKELPEGIRLFLGRHPFPGPGLAIRILGDITPDRVRILQEADDIYIRNLKESGWYDKVWQAGTIFLPVKSVGVMGDERTYEHVYNAAMGVCQLMLLVSLVYRNGAFQSIITLTMGKANVVNERPYGQAKFANF
ncbi:hypothetical protein FQR65_LT15201 [Abscondita terminalis]|nr:hypothetical protein FQR65_LT15201 [Abscondita terminalis]